MAPTTEEKDLLTMQAAMASMTSLLQRFQQELHSSALQHPDIKNPPQPLALLSDSCKILKAQTTKLSLLILNKPFTPSAISYILNSCSNSCLPAMMSALQLCLPEKYTNVFHNQMKSLILKVYDELLNLLASIPQDERGIEPRKRDTLASTGVLWADCDKLIRLASDGIVALVAQKAGEYHDLLKDAISELDEWDPEDDDSESDPGSSLSERKSTQQEETISAGTASTLAVSMDELCLATIVELRVQCLSKLRTIRILYPALKKRRLASFPTAPNNTELDQLSMIDNFKRLDSLVLHLHYFTESADEIAGSLYENDVKQVKIRLSSLLDEASKCATLVSKDWKGQDDEFTQWLRLWQIQLQHVGRPSQ